MLCYIRFSSIKMTFLRTVWNLQLSRWTIRNSSRSVIRWISSDQFTQNLYFESDENLQGKNYEDFRLDTPCSVTKEIKYYAIALTRYTLHNPFLIIHLLPQYKIYHTLLHNPSTIQTSRGWFLRRRTSRFASTPLLVIHIAELSTSSSLSSQLDTAVNCYTSRGADQTPFKDHGSRPAADARLDFTRLEIRAACRPPDSTHCCIGSWYIRVPSALPFATR